jgi:hypothetical protein
MVFLSPPAGPSVTPSGTSTQRVAANLALLSKASERVRRTAAAAIEDLCERLVHRCGENSGEGGYKASGLSFGRGGASFSTRVEAQRVCSSIDRFGHPR